MRIITATETPQEFTSRAAEILKAETTHVYFDTSFLMWLTRVGEEARAQFVNWAATLGDRTHVPLWSMHEYYRHHTGGTLRADLVNRADELMAAAKAFQKEVRKFADQPLISGQSEAAYQDLVDNALEGLREISDAARGWDYDRCAAEVIDWINKRACRGRTVFDSMASLGAKGAARYTQDVPPGFLDRYKEDTPTRGSNRFGDLLFWEEVVQHAKSVQAVAVVVVTRDRKEDWYADAAEPELGLDWKRVKAKWLPVPNPHPTLAFELSIETGAELVLLDELYLGALLWKFGRPAFERLASVAIAVAPGHFDKVDPPPRPVRARAQKRREQATIGLMPARKLLDAAFGEPNGRVAAVLAQLEQDAPVVDEFIERLGVETLEPLSLDEITNLARRLHDGAKVRAGPVLAATGKLLNITDSMPADMAAAAYLGFLSSAYFTDSTPAARPASPFLEDLFAWQGDPAMRVVLRALGLQLRRLRSAALYVPNGKGEELRLRFEHDAEQQQNPVLLTQVYVDQQAVLTEGEARPESQLQSLLGRSEATVRDIARALSRYYGLPFDQLEIDGGEPDDLRLVPEQLGVREFSRFEQEAAPEPALVAPDEDVDLNELDDEDEAEGDDDIDVGVEED